MSKQTKTLHSAFQEKQQQQNLLSNLDKMNAQGTIAPDQYAALKHAYQQKMMAAVSQISHIKQDLGAQLRAAMQELNSCQTELDQIRVSYAAGNLSPKELQRSERKLAGRMENARKEVTRLQALVDAKSSDQLVAAETGYVEKPKGKGIPAKLWAPLIPAIVVLIGAGLFALYCAGLPPFGVDLSKGVELAKPSVVLIQTVADNVTSTCSGVIISEDGIILTTRRVVDGAEDIQVFVCDAEQDEVEVRRDKPYQAMPVADNTTSPLVLIKMVSVDCELTVATLGDSDSPKVGDKVAAIGYNGLADNWTATRPFETWGEVLSKQVAEDGVSYIQTDIAVHPGDTGSALINSRGELVGIITPETLEIGGQPAQNSHLAIAINYAKPLIEDLPGEQ